MTKLFMILMLFVSATCRSQSAAVDAEMDQRVMHLAGELRCLVCQNQTLADSNAQLAIDLKKELREKLAAGMSDQQAIEFMVQRYGDFVLYKPRLQPTTWLLWFGPFLLMFGGLTYLIVRIRRRQSEEQS